MGGDDIATRLLHGVHRLVHCAGNALVKALMHHYGWTKGRALVWV